MNRHLRILHVEDVDDDALLVARRLKKAGYELFTQTVDNREDMARALETGSWDLVLCDHSLPNFGISSALELIGQSGLDLPLIIVSGAIDEDTAVAAMKAGARDYVMKNNLNRLIPVIERELLSLKTNALKKEAEGALAAQVQFLSELLETMPAAIFYKDKDGVYQGCNTLFANWLGKSSKEEIKGRTAFDLLPPPNAFMHNQMDRELLSKGGNTQYETTLDAGEGKERKTLVHKATYSDHAGNIIGIVGVLLDITEIKRSEEVRQELENQLRQAQKLEAIGTLAGGIAHDFNNILAAIVGFSELARAALQGNEKVAKYLDRVLSASDRAKTLTSQILTFCRKSEKTVQPVDVGLIAKEALKLLRATMPPNIKMEINLDSNAGLVNADPTQVHQVLMNLCTNAGHAMGESGGTLSVDVSRVEMSADELRKDGGVEPGGYLKLKVADTGHGMNQATLDRIFEPYYTTKALGEGTGLGLSVVHGIIKGMGGKIDVQSEVDQGTSFTILIPIADMELDAASGGQELDLKGNESILLVDDENALTDILSSQFSKLGYKISAFNSGEEAWEFFQQNPHHFDAVITDMLMPGMPGKELAQKIKEANESIPILIHTGFNECLLEEDGAQSVADAVCLKPMRTKDLALVLRELLDKSKN